MINPFSRGWPRPVLWLCFVFLAAPPLIVLHRSRSISHTSLQNHIRYQPHYKKNMVVSEGCQDVRCNRPLKRSLFLSLDEVAFYAPPPPNPCPADPSFMQVVPRGEGSRWIRGIREILKKDLNEKAIAYEEKGVNLIMNVYDGMAIVRQIEIFYAMCKNLLNINVKKIHLLSEGFTDESVLDKLRCLFSLIIGNLTDVAEEEFNIRALKIQKIKLVPISFQPTYKALLDYSFECCKDQIVVISNSDIYFDNTLACVVGKEKELTTNKHLLAVTRTGAEECPDRVLSHLHDPLQETQILKAVGKNGVKNHVFCGVNKGTADSFVFVPTTELEENGSRRYGQLFGTKTERGNTIQLDFPQNRNGAENYFVEIMHSVYGMTVLNPCRRIALRHMHCSDMRVSDTVTLPEGLKTKMDFDQWTIPPWMDCNVAGMNLYTAWGYEPADDRSWKGFVYHPGED